MRKIVVINILFTVLVFLSAGVSYFIQKGDAAKTTNQKKASIVPSTILTDARDGNEYKVIQIGNQVWMTENLRFASEDSYCYRNKEENCKKYGRLYVNNHHCDRVAGKDKYGYSLHERCMRKSSVTTFSESLAYVCPNMFHIPTKEDWDTLFHAFKEPKKVGKFLKSTEGWRFSNNGEDILGFNVIPVPEDTVEPNRFKGTKSCFWGIANENVIFRCFNLSDSVEYWPQWGNYNHARQIEKMHPVRCVFTPPVEEKAKPTQNKKVNQHLR